MRTRPMAGMIVPLGVLVAGVAHAQAPTDSVGAVYCTSAQVGGGPACPAAHRLVIDVRPRGAGTREVGELLGMVGLAGAQAGVFVLPRGRATEADTAVYAVLDLTRDAAGAYRLVTFLAGPRAPRSPGVDVCRSESTGSGGGDLAFGAYLMGEAAKLARCASGVRLAAR